MAIPLASVVEIVEAEGLASFPSCLERILGVFPYRRDVVPVVSLAERPGLGRTTAVPVVLIARTEQGLWGLPIEREGTSTAEELLDEPGAPFPDAIRRSGHHYSTIDPETTWRALRESVQAFYLANGCAVSAEPVA